MALNPDQKKKGENDQQIAQKSYLMTKFADIMSDEDDEASESDNDFD